MISICFFARGIKIRTIYRNVLGTSYYSNRRTIVNDTISDYAAVGHCDAHSFVKLFETKILRTGFLARLFAVSCLTKREKAREKMRKA